jgi:hypothetical protein
VVRQMCLIHAGRSWLYTNCSTAIHRMLSPTVGGRGDDRTGWQANTSRKRAVPAHVAGAVVAVRLRTVAHTRAVGFWCNFA